MNQDIARAWASWFELWESRVDALTKLRVAANSLRRPELTIGFSTWRTLVTMLKQREIERRELGLRGERDALLEEVKHLRRETDEKLAEAASERGMLIAKIKELGGTAAEAEANLEAQQAAEKAERAQLLGRQITRRMMNRSISMGFMAWVELWEARTYAHSRLREVAGRLQKPELARAFFHWMTDFQEERRAAELAELEERIEKKSKSTKEALESQLRQTRFEMGQLEMRRVAHDDELNAMRERLRSLTDEAVSKDARIWEMSTLRQEHDDLKERYQAAQAALEVASRVRADAEEEVYRQRMADRHLLETLLTEQRQSADDQLKQLQREVYLAELQRGGVERDLATLQREHSDLEDAKSKIERELAELTTSSVQEREAHSTELASLRSQHDTELATLRSDHGSELASLRSQHDAEAQSLRSQLQMETGALRSKLQTQTDAQVAVEKQLAELREEARQQELRYGEEKLKLREKIKGLEVKVASPPSPPQTKKKEKPERKRTGPLGHIDLDESPDAPPISDQIKDALKHNAARVMDLFRSWDADGDGVVTRAEFHKAMPMLGLEVTKASIDELFTSWDNDGEGTLTLKELTRILRSSPNRASPPPSVKTAGNTMAAVKKASSAVAALKPPPPLKLAP